MAKKEEETDETPDITAPSPDVQILETGDLFFFYRPKVDVDEPHSIDDIQRVYLVLRVHTSSADTEATGTSGIDKEQGQSKHPANGEEKGAKGEHAETRGEDSSSQPAQGTVKKELKEEASEEPGPDRRGVKHEKGSADSEKDDKKADTKEEGEPKTKRPKTEPGVADDEEKEVKTPPLKEGELLRLVILGRKRLPDPSKRGRPFWGFVQAVSRDLDKIAGGLGPDEYDTKTRGHRHVGAARAVAQGEYAIVRHSRKTKTGRTSRPDTHFVYKSERFPAAEHEPQDELNIRPEASYIIQVKNPTQPSPPYAGRGANKQPEFPKELMEKMGSIRWAPCDPPDFLNYEGCEFILISASDDLEQELGLEVHQDERLEAELHALVAAAVGPKEEKKLVKPLFEGKWT